MRKVQKQFGFDVLFDQDEMSDIVHDAVLQYFCHLIRPYGSAGEGKLYVGALDMVATLTFTNLCLGLREYGRYLQEVVLQPDGSEVILTDRQARR